MAIDLNNGVGGYCYGDTAKSSQWNAMSSALTMMAWVWLDTSPGGYRCIFSRQLNDTAAETLGLFATGGNYTTFIITSGGTANLSFGATATGVWKHVAVTYDSALGSNRVKTYVDGVATATNNTPSGNVTTSTKTMIVGGNNNGAGNPGTPGESLDGRVADLRFYSRALTANEIADIYNGRGMGGPIPNVEWWSGQHVIEGSNVGTMPSLIGASNLLYGVGATGIGDPFTVSGGT